MNCAIVYSSLTGNTKKVAEALLSVAPKGTKMFSIDNAPQAGHFDLLALGYWVNMGTADSRMAEYMQNLSKRKVFLFGTLGADSSSPYAQTVKNHVRDLLPKENELVGEFLCEGAIETKFMHKWYKEVGDNPNNHHAKSQVENYEHSLSHPDENDLEDAKETFLNILKNYN